MDEIVNPYIAGAPVTEKRMFFGREDIFQWIENSIAGQYADHILVVHGQRRVGKTSVLKQLGNRLPKRFIPVFFDLQGRTHTSLDHFLWWLAREIVRVLKQDRGIESSSPDQHAFSADPEYFENQFLAGLRSALGNNTLLLTFDEFDNLEESEVKEELARPLIDHLRRLMGQPNLNFIFSIGSSGRKLENMQAAYTDFFKTALYKKISFLNEEQTHNLVTRPVEGIIEYERAAVDRIYGITSGHPYFTQLTCHELFARCQRTEQRKIAKADVEAILDDVVERGTVNLKFVWDEATDIEKWSLAALAQLDKADNRALADFLRKNRVRFSETDLTSGLLHLREKDVLTPQNRFVIHLLRRWLQKNRPIEQAREELTEANPIASRFIEIGLEFRDSGQYEKAIEYFRQALSVSSDNLQAQVNIALTYSAQGMLDQAVIEFEKALVMDDEDVVSRAGLCEAHLKLGDLAMSKKRVQDAIQSYQRILKINTEHTEARGRMAEISRQRAEKALSDGRDEEAMSAFAEALKYTPEDEKLSARVEAVQAERKAKIVASLVAKSEREARELNWDAAIRTLEEAAALSPEDSDIRKRLSNAREEHHQRKLADLKARAQGLADAEKFDEALKTWQEYLSLDPNAAEQVEEETIRIKSQQELFDLYTTAGQAIASRNFDQAIKLLKEVIYRDENYKDASRLLTKAIESRRTGATQKPGKPRRKPAPAQSTRAQIAPKISGKQIGVIGGLVAVLALVAAGVFFGPKLWDAISKQQAAGGTPTQQIAAVTPTLPAELVSFEPILAYIANTPPDFTDVFLTPKGYWWTTQVDVDLVGDRISDSVFHFSDRNGGEGFVIKELQGRDFVLEFDYGLNSEDENSHLIVDYHLGNGGSNVIKFNPNSFGLQAGSGDNIVVEAVEIAADHVYHFQVLVQKDQFAIYINNELITYAGNAVPGDGTGISFGTYAETGFDASLDNIKFWNLETFSSDSEFARPILTYTANTSPDFEEDFSTPKEYWTTQVDGIDTIADRVSNGVFNFSDNSDGISDEGFHVETMQGQDFVLEFDYTVNSKDENSHLIVHLRLNEYNENETYTLKFNPQWWQLGTNGGNLETASNRTYNFRFMVIGNDSAVYINNELLTEDNAVPSFQSSFTGIGIHAEAGYEGNIDNIKFWDLETFYNSSVAAPTITPDPRVLSVRNQHSYLFVKSEKTWHDARDYCAAQGGYLATIQDSAENDMLANLLAGNAWLGATDEVEEGTWVWVSGEPWGYTNWNKDSSQPDNDQGQEHYLEFEMNRTSPMFGTLRPSDWNDKPREEKNFFFCEWEPAASGLVTPPPTQKASTFYGPILAYTESQPPAFEDDFSSSKQEWGSTSEGVPITEMIKEHALSIRKNNDTNMTFPTNGLFDAANFIIQFDLSFSSQTSVTNLAFQFRTSISQDTHYQINFSDMEIHEWMNRWQFLETQENKSKMTAGGFANMADGFKRVLIVANEGHLAIFVNNILLLERENIRLTGRENFFDISEEPSDGDIWVDNVKFWNLDGVDFPTSTGTTVITPAPTSTAPATLDTRILNKRILNPANQHLYLYVEQTKSWSDARDYCAGQGGYLVTIQDAAENVFIFNLTEEGWAWLGATDEVDEGTWIWVSGEPWKYSKWAYQQPSGEDYLTYKAGLVGDKNWDDVVVDSRPFVCEWEATP